MSGNNVLQFKIAYFIIIIKIAYFIIIAEIIDLTAFVIIFIGLRKKANY